MKGRALILVLIAHCAIAHAQQDTTTERWVERVALRGQFAGMQGLLSVGALLNLGHDKVQAGFMYGFAPGTYNSPDFHGLTLRTTYSPRRFSLADDGSYSLAPYIAMSGMVEVSGISYLVVPERFPDGYYTTQAVHGILGAGLKFTNLRNANRWAISLETVALDTELYYFFRGSFGFAEIWSMSLGLEYCPFK